MRAQMRRIALVTTLALGGCSFFIGTESRKHADGSARCMSIAWPVVDTALTIAAAVPVVQLGREEDDEAVAQKLALGLSAIPLTLAAAAIYGYVKAEQCPATPTTTSPR